MNSIKHVAIIMDGNGRWGVKNKKKRNLGHKAGLATIEKIIQTLTEDHIKKVEERISSKEKELMTI